MFGYVRNVPKPEVVELMRFTSLAKSELLRIVRPTSVLGS
jgi:hypothetical protein